MGKQKRSENTYQKINTIFKRDANNVIMPYDEFAVPELEWLRDCKFIYQKEIAKLSKETYGKFIAEKI